VGIIKDFFNREQLIDGLKTFRTQLSLSKASNDFEVSRNQYLGEIIVSMINYPEEWNRYCQTNIKWIGTDFSSLILNHVNVPSSEFLNEIFFYGFRFVLEYDLSKTGELSIELKKAKEFAIRSVEDFDDFSRGEIEFALKQMPIMILKELINHESIQTIKDFNKLTKDAEISKNEQEKDLKEREERVETLRKALSKYETGFNFVGLYQGFENLFVEKEREKRSYLFWLRITAFLIIAPLVSELIILYLHLGKFDDVKNVLAISIIPTISLVVILIYFFRVILYNYNSVKSQLLQISLRKTLCMFIQDYSKYASKLKEEDSSSLEKFESIIFSGLVSNNESIPATFDGVEQLGKMIKSFKQ
jgi:hypothetical protein